MAKRKKKKYLLTFLTSAGEKTFISKSLSTEDLEAAIPLKKPCKDRVFLLDDAEKNGRMYLSLAKYWEFTIQKTA